MNKSFSHGLWLILFISLMVSGMNDQDHGVVLQVFDHFNKLAGAICRLDYNKAYNAYAQGCDAHGTLAGYLDEDNEFTLACGNDRDSLSLLGLLQIVDISFCDLGYSDEVEEQRYRLAQFLLEDCNVDPNQMQYTTYLKGDEEVFFSIQPIDLAISRLILHLQEDSGANAGLSLVKLFFQYHVALTTMSLNLALAPITCEYLVDRCLQQGVNLNEFGWSFYSTKQITPLMVACCAGKALLVRKLLDHGADPNVGIDYQCPVGKLTPFQVLLENVYAEDIILNIALLLFSSGLNHEHAFVIFFNAFGYEQITEELYDDLLIIYEKQKKRRNKYASFE